MPHGQHPLSADFRSTLGKQSNSNVWSLGWHGFLWGFYSADWRYIRSQLYVVAGWGQSEPKWWAGPTPTYGVGPVTATTPGTCLQGISVTLQCPWPLPIVQKRQSCWFYWLGPDYPVFSIFFSGGMVKTKVNNSWSAIVTAQTMFTICSFRTDQWRH